MVHPLGPGLAGVGQNLFVKLPFMIPGVIKGSYDLVL